MDEQTKTQETSAEGPTQNSNEGSKYETTPIIERAREERERLERATAAQKIENDRTEAIQARNALGGRSEGAALEEVKAEQTPQEYASQIMSGKADGTH
tara:strand:+ start:123 stop:419 length:297 start_codon:yes stop_codon:yes gene_type:complete